jgi:K+-sensing histidine kinase KdpD
MANATGEPSNPARDAAQHLVIVPVASFDRRALQALHSALQRPDTTVRAVHVASDDAAAAALAVQWFEHGMSSLDIIDLEPAATVEQTITDWVERTAASHAGPVTVVLGRLVQRRAWHRVLHRRTAARVAARLARLPDVRIKFADVPVVPCGHDLQSSKNRRVAVGSKPVQWVKGLLAGLAAVSVCTLALLPARGSVTVATPALTLIVPGIVAGLVGGRVVGVITAAIAAVVLDVVFVEPYGRLSVHVVDDVVSLAAFTAVALAVATLVALANDRRRAAEQRADEILALSKDKERLRTEHEQLASEKSALVQAEDARRALLRSVSHDLRTPLATIRAITSDLRDGTAYDEPTRNELLELAGDEAERLDRLVANLLSMSRIEAGALQPVLQAAQLDELVTDRVRRLSRVTRDVRVDTDVPPDLPLVDADYMLVDQVITNLLENAVRHSPPHSTVHIAARDAGELVEVSISDQGPGIPHDQRDWIFEPFRTGTASRSSGVGLAICKAIVEAHGGRICVTEAPGGGARFSFTLPTHRLRTASGA